MKTIIAGSRDYTNYQAVRSIMDRCPWAVTEVVCGGARGADAMGDQWAKEKGVAVKPFPADWKRQPDGSYDKTAGFKRNEEMAVYADACVAFWDGESPGTRDMIDRALAHKLHLLVVQV